LQTIQEKIGITAYFNNQTSEREILNLKAEIELMDDVTQVEYIPNTVAVEIFRELHKDEPLLIEALENYNSSENPLPNTFAIKASKLESYSKIAETLKSDRYAPYFERIRDNGKVIQRLLSITNTIKYLGVILAVIFVIVTIMVMFNTIRLTIYNRRQEVEIMRLVGATNWYIRMPFIIEGMMYGFIATVITTTVMYGALRLMSGQVESLLSLDNIDSLTSDLLLQIGAMNLILGLGLGVIASFIAMRRYLKI
jgi:cell division transport system permease protein